MYPSQGDGINPHVIQHPLEEAEEVALHFSTSRRLGSSCRGWHGERVLWSSTEGPLVVTVNEVNGPASSGLASSISLSSSRYQLVGRAIIVL